MSLLMEALKKAEEAKRLASEAPATDSPGLDGLSLEPIAPSAPPAVPTAGGSRLPDLAQHLDSVDAELAAVPTAPPLRARPTPVPAQSPRADAAAKEKRMQEERSAAKKVFAAKMPPKNNAPQWVLLSLGVVALLGIGGYFWWQWQALSGKGAMQPSLAVQVPSAPSAAQGTALVTQSPPVGLPPAIPSSAIPDVPPTPSLPAARAAAPVDTMAVTSAFPAVRADAPESLLKPTARGRAAADTPVRLSANRSSGNATLMRAYDDLLADRLPEAQQGYEGVLRQEPRNTDALLGLATLAVRQGQFERAQSYYLRVLEADPNDSHALAGLSNLRSGQGEAGLSESRLKSLLSMQPDAAALHFALGNVFARQQRWSEAQQAYFRAYALDAENPDYVFNLAVALDQLRQSKLAHRYYTQALALAGKRSAAFDKQQAKARLLELQP